jgi:hypothetical protein
VTASTLAPAPSAAPGPTPSSSRLAAADYGLARPELADARAAVQRIDPVNAEQRWQQIVADARAFAPGAPTLADVIDAMKLNPHPVIALCARSQEIRLAAFRALTDRGLTVNG